MSASAETAPAKSGRGGKRANAGRKPKPKGGPSALPEIEVEAALAAPVPDEIESVASVRAKGAIAALVRVIQFGKNEQAKVNACNKILDRGYGKPSIDAGGFGQLSMFPIGVNINVALANEIRDYARGFAMLAIETLEAIAARGQVEGARVSAANSLIDRGIGTVATAKVPEGAAPKPLGKKEEAAAAARNAAAGKFATPAPPPRPIDTVQ